MKIGLWLRVFFVGPIFCSGAFSAEMSKEDLLALIESLQKRVEHLEAQLETRFSEGEAVGLAGRVAVVEEKLEQAAAAPRDEDFRVYWKDGLRFESHDGDFKMKLGGRMHLDHAWFDDSSKLRTVFGDTEDAVNFRRARVEFSGEVYRDYEFKMQFDFAGGDADFRDVYFGVQNIPYIGRITVGQFKEPFSLEELTSSNDLTFMERALPNVFAPSRGVGISTGNSHFNDRFTWSAGVFRAADDFGFHAQDGSYNATVRVTGLPWVGDDDSDARLLHLGAAYSRRNPDGGVRFRQRPESGLAMSHLDTGTFSADRVDLYGVEAAFLYGRFSLQGEYMLAKADSPVLGSLSFDGWYVQGSVFLTGDSRRYKRGGGLISGVFAGVKPERPFRVTGGARGPGAWELALRYSELDLNDGKLRGGAGGERHGGFELAPNPEHAGDVELCQGGH